MTTLYHYTNGVGKDGIYRKKRILAKDPGDSLELGVYFTELQPPPATSRADLLKNNFGDRADSLSQDEVQKIRYWLKFKLEDLPSGTHKVTTASGENWWRCPVDVHLNGKKYLYHYTNRAGKDAIYQSGHILAQRPHGGSGVGATMPVGVYFTELTPTTPVEDLMFHMYGVRDSSRKDLIERTKFWFKFEMEELVALGARRRKTRLHRNEWVCPVNVTIPARETQTVRGGVGGRTDRYSKISTGRNKRSVPIQQVTGLGRT